MNAKHYFSISRKFLVAQHGYELIRPKKFHRNVTSCNIRNGYCLMNATDRKYVGSVIIWQGFRDDPGQFVSHFFCLNSIMNRVPLVFGCFAWYLKAAAHI